MVKVNLYRTKHFRKGEGCVIEGEAQMYPFFSDLNSERERSVVDTALFVIQHKDELGSMNLYPSCVYYGYITFDDNLNVLEEVYETIH